MLKQRSEPELLKAGAASEPLGAMQRPTADLRGFMQAILDTGYEGPWGVEVISRELAARPLAEASRLAFQTTIRQFEGF